MKDEKHPRDLIVARVVTEPLDLMTKRFRHLDAQAEGLTMIELTDPSPRGLVPLLLAGYWQMLNRPLQTFSVLHHYDPEYFTDSVVVGVKHALQTASRVWGVIAIRFVLS